MPANLPTESEECRADAVRRCLTAGVDAYWFHGKLADDVRRSGPTNHVAAAGNVGFDSGDAYRYAFDLVRAGVLRLVPEQWEQSCRAKPRNERDRMRTYAIREKRCEGVYATIRAASAAGALRRYAELETVEMSDARVSDAGYLEARCGTVIIYVYEVTTPRGRRAQ